MLVRLRLETDPDRARRAQRAASAGGYERFFLRRQKDESLSLREEIREDIEIDRWILFGRRHEHGALGDNRHTEEAGRVAEGPEEDEVVVAAVGPQVFEQLR